MTYVRSPSKFLSKSFLIQLKKDHFISPSGKEYQENLVQDLLNEKASKNSDLEYDRQLKEKLPVQNPWAKMRSFQDSIFKSLEIKSTNNQESTKLDTTSQKMVSTDNAHLNFKNNTTFQLKELPGIGLLAPRHDSQLSEGMTEVDRSYEPKGSVTHSADSHQMKKQNGGNVQRTEVILHKGVKTKTHLYTLEEIKKDRKQMEVDKSFLRSLLSKPAK